MSEQHIEEAIALFVDIEKTVVEGAGAAALAAVVQHPEIVRRPTRRGDRERRQPRRARARRRCCCARSPDPADWSASTSTVTDRPGVLAAIATIVAAAHGNIVDVEHRRDLPGVALKETRLDLSIETRDRKHADEIVAALAAAGFPAEIA